MKKNCQKSPTERRQAWKRERGQLEKSFVWNVWVFMLGYFLLCEDVCVSCEWVDGVWDFFSCDDIMYIHLLENLKFMSHNSLSYSPLTLLPNVLITPSVTKLLNCFQIKNVISNLNGFSVNLPLITAINKTVQSRRYAENPRDGAVFEASGPQGHFLKKK